MWVEWNYVTQICYQAGKIGFEIHLSTLRNGAEEVPRVSGQSGAEVSFWGEFLGWREWSPLEPAPGVIGF